MRSKMDLSGDFSKKHTFYKKILSFLPFFLAKRVFFINFGKAVSFSTLWRALNLQYGRPREALVQQQTNTLLSLQRQF
ncbi:hypothetical protein [Microbulbifer halophilus]|uniref:hypothetical protein n=1 Tax=Microbulbifer halophilus TaxID=453963 RepID=UPI00361FB7BF